MVNILGEHMNGGDLSDLSPYLPLLKTGKIHLYGKAETRTGRKMGHVNVLGGADAALELINGTGIWRG
jgi:5-(carboxyamino)imidazole ribonucleotide synthase